MIQSNRQFTLDNSVCPFFSPFHLFCLIKEGVFVLIDFVLAKMVLIKIFKLRREFVNLFRINANEQSNKGRKERMIVDNHCVNYNWI